MFDRILKLSFIVVMVSLLLAGMAWAANWKVANIGGDDSEQGPYTGGDVEFISGGFIITATGGDIWSNKLGCTLAYIDGGLSGNFTIEYTIVEHTGEPSTTWTKCGVMVAQAVDPETPFVFLASMPSNNDDAFHLKGCKLVTRPEWAGEATPGSDGFAPLRWPVTYKLVREGDLFTASLSFDGGATYQSVAAGDKLDNTTLAMDDPVVVGIAINGHNAGATTGTATVIDIKVNGQDVISAVDSAGKLVKTWAALKAY